MCVVYSYTLIHNNADKLHSSCPVPLTPRPLSQETNKERWPVSKALNHVVALAVAALEAVTEAEEEDSAEAQVATEVDVSYLPYLFA